MKILRSIEKVLIFLYRYNLIFETNIFKYYSYSVFIASNFKQYPKGRIVFDTTDLIKYLYFILYCKYDFIKYNETIIN